MYRIPTGLQWWVLGKRFRATVFIQEYIKETKAREAEEKERLGTQEAMKALILEESVEEAVDDSFDLRPGAGAFPKDASWLLT